VKTVSAIREVKYPNFSEKIRIFFGGFVLMPFERDLLNELQESLPDKQRNALEKQLIWFNHVSRLLKHREGYNANGYTRFHRTKRGEPILRTPYPFDFGEVSTTFAKAIVSFENGAIDVEFKAVHSRFLSMEYRSKQKVYYPTSNYQIDLELLMLD